VVDGLRPSSHEINNRRIQMLAAPLTTNFRRKNREGLLLPESC
jgi:hypothetical protein